MTDTTRWWWVRHAPAINPDGVIYGHRDMEADFSDEEGLRRLARRLPPGAVGLTTTLRRARGTADRLAALGAFSDTVHEDDRLREQAFGGWEGRRWDDIPERESAAYWRDPAANRAPGGESFVELRARVGAAVDALNDEFPGRDIVAIAHAGSIRAALVHALGCGPAAGLSFHLVPLSLTRMDAIRTDRGIWWRILGVNLPCGSP